MHLKKKRTQTKHTHSNLSTQAATRFSRGAIGETQRIMGWPGCCQPVPKLQG